MEEEKQRSPKQDTPVFNHVAAHTQELREIKALAKQNLEAQFARRGKPWGMCNHEEKFDKLLKDAELVVGLLFLFGMLSAMLFMGQSFGEVRGTANGACAAVGGVPEIVYGSVMPNIIKCDIISPDGNITTKAIKLK